MKNLLIILLILSIGTLPLYAQDKISPRLIESMNQALEDNSMVAAIVLLSDQVDIISLDQELYARNVSLEERAYNVITTLQSKANQTQPEIVDYLSSKSVMEVSKVNRFWISNILLVEAIPAILTELSERADIAYLDLDAELEWDEPVDESPAQESPNGHEIGLERINAHLMWQAGYTGAGRIVMNDDTGVDGNHPALNYKWRGAQPGVPASAAWFDPETNTTFPVDPNSHGTHTIGTMCGLEPATNDTIGVAFGAQWIASKTINSPHTTNSIAAWQWAIDPDNNPSTIDDMPDAIGNSWWDPNIPSANQCDPALNPYINVSAAVEAAGIAIVFSAGNSGPGASTITSPKNYNLNEVTFWATGAVDGNNPSLPIADFSSRGPVVSQCVTGVPSLDIKPEASAPGVSVRSSIPGTSYGNKSGTSMACPHVVGAIALLREAHPTITGYEAKMALYQTAADLGTPGEDNTFGTGIIDVWAAHLSLADPLDPNSPDNFTAYSDYSTPTSMLLSWDDPTNLVSGDTLLPSQFTIEINRDGTPVGFVVGGTEIFTDLGLNDGQVYDYTIYTKLNVNDSTSNEVAASWTAGGAGQPNPPAALSIINAGGGDLQARWTNPATNIDGTPMDDFDAINLYEDGTLLTTFTRTTADTGRADSATFTPGGANLEYYVTAVDNETPANESAGSNSAYPPFSAPYAQDFEGATPGTPGTLPVQWTNQTDDDFDWNVDNGGTPSSNTGPTVDHTLGTAAGIYMYTETSSPITTGDVAHLTTPFLDVSTVTAPNLSFWYHMYGVAMGELHVDVYFNGMWNLDVMQPALIGQQQAAQTDPWRQAVVDLSPYTSQPIQLRFRGICGTSFTSDMAIDDVVISSLQSDPQMVVAPTAIDDTLLVGDSTSHDITISNTQPLPSLLNYTVTVDGGASWITVDTDSGQVGPLASDVMVLSVNTIGLTAGNYSGTVTVAGNDPANPTDVITVNLVANEAPVVSVSPDSLHFTVNTAGVDSMMFTISNTGNGPLTFDLTDEDILGDYIRTAAVDRSYIRPEYNVDIPKDQTDWRTGTPQTEGAGGPDIFGYKWIDSDEPGGPVFNFIDISSTGTLVTGLTDDNFVGPFPIGFTFSYYGNDYTDYYIGSNGMIGFGSSTGLNSLSNVQIPTAATPNNMIAWLWDDLDPGNPLTSVYYQTMGNMLVIQFDHYFEYPDGGAWVDAEMIIYANGNIKVQYDNFEPGFDLVGCTVGIENSDGTDGLQVVFNGAYLHDDLALLFYRESQWLSTNPTTGTVPPGGSVDIQAIVDAAGLFGGNYLATVIVNSNDPVTPELRSPRVSLTVGGLAVLAVTPDPVVFDTTFVGATADQPVMVENTGTDTLRITNITSTESVFTVDTTNLVLDPLSGYSMTVMFDPLLPQVYSGWLVFESNTPTSPDSVAISGTGVNPPIMVLSPNFTNPVTVNQGDSTDIFINMSNTGGSNLLWTAAVSNSPVTSDRLIFPKFGPSQSLASADASPVQTLPGSHAFIEAPWDLQFSFDATAASGAAGNAGAEFDGTNYYTTRWASNLIHQYDLSGTMTLEFSIAGVTGLRDLAYDGALFYGGAAANTIFVMDFATQTLLGTISSPVGVRNISYDDGADGFWVGNWADPPTLIDRSGSTIATLTTGLAGQYGAAYDGWSDGGPYLWVFDQGTGAGFPQLVHQFDLNTLTATGFTYDVASDFPAAAGIAGGLWTGEGVVSGKVSIGGLLQGTPDNFFVYELTDAGAAWLRIIGANSGSIAPMDQFDLTARVYGVPADEDTAWVAFLTNDPALPAADVMVVRDFITGLSGLEVLPTTFDVAQNYPNPFNPTTTISYQVPEATDVRLVIYNVLGQRVRTLVNDRMEPGYHSVVWDGLSEDGRTVASGIYIYRFEASDFTKTLKLMLLK